MDAQIYEVLDAIADGIRLQVQFQPRVNYSLVSSGIPFIRAIVVHNETGHELGDTALTAELQMGEGATWTHVIQGPIAVDAVTRIDDPKDFGVFSPQFAKATEASPATLKVSVDRGPSILAAVEVSAANEFLNFPGLWAALAAFVQPNERAVTGILRAASDLLLKRTGSGSLDGHQGEPQRPTQIAGALYEALRGLEVTYINPPASFELTGQKVRTTTQVLTGRFGTCIDLAVLYAACLEASGLNPVIFLTANHSFAGYYATGIMGTRASSRRSTRRLTVREMARLNH